QEDRPLGITANSFASVSLDPPLVMWCPAKSSRRFEAFSTAKGFAIHVLAAHQKAMGDRFAKDGHAFKGLPWSPAHDGTPLIETVLARFHCIPHAFHDGGDHVIAVGKVVEAAYRDGDPLIFANGAYTAPH
ncbi:MAG: flavin reductase family protein, partial [Shimia sp.]